MEDVKSESAATSVIRSAKSSDLIRIAKSSRPESVRAHFERNAVGGSVRGENPPRFQGVLAKSQILWDSRSIECTSKRTQGFVLSFPLFRLSRSDNLPRRRILRVRREAQCAPLIARFLPCPRGCSSAGRAPALQAGGQRFESAHLHQHIDNRIGLSRSPECRKAKSGSSFEFDVRFEFLT